MILADLRSAAGRVADAVGPAVVRIEDGGGGNGLVVGDGAILTNAHNVRSDAIPLLFTDGRSTEASVSGVDADGNVAILAAATADVSAVERAAEAAVIGQPVFAVGASRRGPRVSFGLVSAVGQAMPGPRGRRLRGAIEHTAPLARGSSGSALVDVDGRLLGVNVIRLGSGFYQALPADDALWGRIARLTAGESVERPRIGVAVAPAWVAKRMRAAVGLSTEGGLLVREVVEASRAEQAGIAVGDLLLAVDGTPLEEPDDLADAIDRATDGLTISLLRGDTPIDVEVPITT